MIMPITIQEMQRLNIACKRVLGDEQWERRSEVAWESLRGLEFVTADMLESAIMDGFDVSKGVHFTQAEVAQLRTLVEYLKPSYVGGEAGHALRMLAWKVGR